MALTLHLPHAKAHHRSRTAVPAVSGPPLIVAVVIGLFVLPWMLATRSLFALEDDDR